MRPFLFGTNLKMHQTPEESRGFLLDVCRYTATDEEKQLFFIPPFTSLSSVAAVAKQSGIWLGGQNMHWAESGAYTGEISAGMLRAAGANMVLLGHAERRQYFNETDQALQKKVQTAMKNDLRVLLCVGDTADERQGGVHKEVISRQVRIALERLEPVDPGRLMIAYEPVWSIGEGGTAASADAVAEIMGQIRSVMGELYGPDGRETPILYGGSVSLDNCREYAELEDVDGLFVGRSAWTALGFWKVMSTALQTRAKK